ncbi:MAG: hypothetical protein ABJA80_06110, partial [bacterium]
MKTLRTTLCSILALAAACASSSNEPPQGQPMPGQSRQGQRSPFDSSRGNRVTENARPDPAARAGLI